MAKERSPVEYISREQLLEFDILLPGEGWYFWDETWANLHGPFPSELEANQACLEYAEQL